MVALLSALLAIGALACGAASGSNSGEIIFDFGADEEAESEADAGRQPLSLDAGLDGDVAPR
ncbi:MAG: hypothetical protein JRH11_03510 [Deltaproteobacteria bacterium]|nr:hypothetical protein [Deltaproteobacteria bacterium]